MKPDVEYSLKKLNSVFAKLQEGVKQVVDELDRDGVIQRFEFTFELFWKTTSILLEYEGFHCAGPRSCIKEGARRGFLKHAETLLDMLEDRNKATHIYDETTARGIYGRIRSQYTSVLEENIRIFDAYISESRQVDGQYQADSTEVEDEQ